MYLRLLIILLLLGTASHADPDYYLVVTSDDQVKVLDHIIDAINYFFDIDAAVNDGALRYESLLKFVVLLGVLYATVQLSISSMTGNASAGFKHYVVYLFSIVFVLIIIYGPKSSMLIQTEDGSTYASQRSVPQLFAFSIGFFSTLRHELNELSETAFDIPDASDNFASGGASGLGYVGMETTLSGVFKDATFDKYRDLPDLQSMYSRYVRDCVVMPSVSTFGMANSKVNGYLRSPSIKNDIAPAATGFATEFITYNGGTETCQAFWDGSAVAKDEFGASFIGLEPALTSFEGNATSGSYQKLGSALAYAGALMENQTAISNAAAVKSALTQSVLSNEFKSTFAAMGVAGEVMADGAAQATSDIQMGGISTGMYMSRMLPVVSFWVYALMIAATPFMIAFALLPGALSVLINFMRTLLWVSLWEPMANIIGIFIDYYFSEVLIQNSFNTVNGVLAITPTDLIDVSSEAATMAGIAGSLYVAVQGLSWMLVTGSGQMLGNLMGGMASSFQKRANADAQLESRTDLQETALLSEEMGRSISQREKYAYQANTQAAMNAGAIGGSMHAFGDGMGGIQSMSHTGAVTGALQHSGNIGMANELGSGSDAVRMGVVKGRAAGGAVKGEYEGYGGSGDTASETSRKSSRHQTGTQVSNMKNHTNDTIDDSATVQGLSKFGAQTGEVSGYIDGKTGKVDQSKVMSTSHQNSDMSVREDIAKGDVLSKMDNRDKNNIADLNAGTTITAKDTQIKDIAAHNGGSPEEAVEQIVTQTGDDAAVRHVGSSSKMDAQGGVNDNMSNVDTTQSREGSQVEADARELHESHSKGVTDQDMAETEANKKTGADASFVQNQQAEERKQSGAEQKVGQAEQKVKTEEQKVIDAAVAKEHHANRVEAAGQISSKIKETEASIEAATDPEAKADLQEQLEGLEQAAVDNARSIGVEAGEVAALIQEGKNAKVDEAHASLATAQEELRRQKNVTDSTTGDGYSKTLADGAVKQTAKTGGETENMDLANEHDQADARTQALNSRVEAFVENGTNVQEVETSVAAVKAIQEHGMIVGAEHSVGAAAEAYERMGGSMPLLEAMGYEEGGDAAVNAAAMRSLGQNISISTNVDGATMEIRVDDAGGVGNINYDDRSTTTTGAKFTHDVADTFVNDFNAIQDGDKHTITQNIVASKVIGAATSAVGGKFLGDQFGKVKNTMKGGDVTSTPKGASAATGM